MIRLQDRVWIRATPEQVFKWFETLPQEYVSWHPDHIACQVLNGSMLKMGSEVQFEEVLHGKRNAMRFRLTGVEYGAQIKYEIVGLGAGSFQVVQKGEEVEFSAELLLGSKLPLFGRIIDLVLPLVFSRRLEAMRKHMREEGQNLKKILESRQNLQDLYPGHEHQQK